MLSAPFLYCIPIHQETKYISIHSAIQRIDLHKCINTNNKMYHFIQCTMYMLLSVAD